MKRKHKIEIFLVIVISLVIPLLLAYIDYNILTEADFFSTPQFENPDLDYLLLCKKQNLMSSSSFSHGFSDARNLAQHFSCLYYQVTFPEVKAPILRC